MTQDMESVVGAESGPAIGPEHFLNREMSWLEFNARVLEEAEDETNPLLERVKFLSIFSSNLDEFFMVRISGVRSQMLGLAEPEDRLPEQHTVQDVFQLCHVRAHELVDRQCRLLREQLLPQLAGNRIRLLQPSELSEEQQHFMEGYFRQTVFPVLTPMAIDPSHPTPHLRSRGLYMAAIIEQRPGARSTGPRRMLAAVQLPPVLPRLIRLPGGADDFVLLETVVAARLDQLFGGSQIVCSTTMRITRDADFDLDGDQVLQDLSRAVEEGLKTLRHREVVRLEVAAGTHAELLELIRKPLRLYPQETYEIDGPLDLTTFMDWHGLEGHSALRDEPYTPRRPAGLEDEDLFEAIRKRDVLVHHPYESFHCIIDFLTQAAEDPDVLAIKQTLYRTGHESPVIRALIAAAEKGKNVTAVVELLARFDEQSNVNWARQLERAGVHVVFGFVDLKTHCKVTLVVRREGDKLRRYVHLGTGNYNATTAKIYTDFGLFTCRRRFGEDASALFNLLTGYSQGHEWQCFTVSPFHLHQRVLDLVHREMERARAGQGGYIAAKLNALVDPDVIVALYRASQAGVKCDLIVRGSCCLRPGVPGLSENIRVISILDRFLEHSRVCIFGRGDDADVYISSADWMPRNFRRRVEVMWPIIEPALKRRMLHNYLPTLLGDNIKAREMQPDGKYRRVTRKVGELPFRAQLKFLEEVQAAAGENEIDDEGSDA